MSPLTADAFPMIGPAVTGQAGGRSPSVIATFSQEETGVTGGNLAAASRLGPGLLAFRLAWRGVDPVQGFDENGNPTREHHPVALVTGLSWSEALGDRLSYGAGLSWIQEDLDIDGHRAQGLSADMGASFTPGSRRFTWGFAIRHLGAKIAGHTASERSFGDLPLEVTGSLRTVLDARGRTALLAEVRQHLDTRTDVRFGLEQSLTRALVVRGAVRSDLDEIGSTFNEALLGGPPRNDVPTDALRASFGASFRQDRWNLDYAWQWRGDQGSAQHLGITFGWGGRPVRSRPVSG